MGPRGNQVASDLAKSADVILALGTRLGFNSTFYSYDNLNREAKIIQVELDPGALGRFFPIATGIWGDATKVAQQILSELQKLNFTSSILAWKNEFINNRRQYLNDRDSLENSHPIQPKNLFKILRDNLPKETAITLDAGTLCLQATDALNYYQPKSLFTPLDFGLIGFSFACGLGVKLAQPKKTVVSLMGDGGFGMSLSEISTAVEK